MFGSRGTASRGGPRRPRLAYVATHGVSVDVLLRGQLAFMREQGFDVVAISAPGPVLDRVRRREGIEVVGVPMQRDMDPTADAASLVRLTAALRAARPDIVNAGTPKAGLLGMMAARALRVPIRIYLVRGLRLETSRGVVRTILGATERVASGCAQDVVCVSRSLERAVVDGGYASRRKVSVLGEGSSNGVDSERFRRSDATIELGRLCRERLDIPADAPVVGFVGRLAEDKGVVELLDAFELVRNRAPRAVLLVVGGDLADQSGASQLSARARSAPGVRIVGSVDDLVPYYAAMDVLALPSYREGFPNVVLEAGAMEVPVVGFRSTGVIDAIEDGTTGALVEQGDVAELARQLQAYLEERGLAAETGRRARRRIERSFSRRVVWSEWLAFYRARLRQCGLPHADPNR